MKNHLKMKEKTIQKILSEIILYGVSIGKDKAERLIKIEKMLRGKK